MPIIGDGNCFYRALSLLLTGDDNYNTAKEIRRDLMEFLEEELYQHKQGIENRNWWQMFYPQINELEEYIDSIKAKT